MRDRTLVFCTSYSDYAGVWNGRYRQWLDYIRFSGLHFDEIIMVDDGSPVLPVWDDVAVYVAGSIPAHSANLSIHRFSDRLGQQANGLPFPGWYRSFSHAVNYGVAAGFRKIIHVESDSYLLSRRAVDFFNDSSTGWVAPWCRKHAWPESALQIINADRFQSCLDFFNRPYSDHVAAPVQPIENALPYTAINRQLVGDRYGEIETTVPFNADFAAQVGWNRDASYYWWIADVLKPADGPGAGSAPTHSDMLHHYRSLTADIRHSGADYRQFLSFLDQHLFPEGYFEIGTHRGDSVAQFSCDSICIDPHFVIVPEALQQKARVFLFQMTSDRFFQTCDPKRHLDHLDIGFLDGLHYYEALLRDFINFERHAHSRSIAILHDCLPLNIRMTSRQHLPGPPSEPEATRDFWTGDVWKVLPILLQLRPDLEIIGVECPPTGLILISGLDPTSTVLDQGFDSAVETLSKTTLEDFTLSRLWKLVPMLDSRRVIDDPKSFCRHYKLR